MNRLIFAALTLFATGAMALTLKEQKAKKLWQDQLVDPATSYGKQFKDACGYDLPVTFEEKMVTPYMEAGGSAASSCDYPRMQMASMCEDETSKAAIKKNIKKIDCKLGAKETIAFKLSGGTFTITVGTGTAGIDAKTKEWLENNLK